MKKNLFLILILSSVLFIACDKDKTPPEITLIGDEVVYTEVGQPYNDPGATAMDDEDGDLTDKIMVSSDVNVNIEGQYVVIYSVTDRAGNDADNKTRKVIVTFF